MIVLPPTQSAVQLIGPGRLVLNRSKELVRPGPYQLLCKVEAVGICFSDLKLLKQFSRHVRKGPIISGIDPSVLEQIPSYVPGDEPTVPGHEAVVRIVAVGEKVSGFEPGGRYLVQTDYRWLPTDGSNAAFGYNFEGALQEYVLMDTRIITSPAGSSMLLPVSEQLSASAVAMVEPWACVEHAYRSKERNRLKENGRVLVVADVRPSYEMLIKFLKGATLARIDWLSAFSPPDIPAIRVIKTGQVSALAATGYDDVIYFGAEPATVESLFRVLAPCGLLNIIQCGRRFGRDITTPIGAVHYAGIRIAGTCGWNVADSLNYIPSDGRIRPADGVHIVGAGGPMGMMHVIRCICQGLDGVRVVACDLDNKRLARLNTIAAPLARKFGVAYRAYNPQLQSADETFDYIVIMAPVPELVARAIYDAAEQGIINVFAGIAETTTVKLDLDRYIKKQLYFVGTSGSVLEDMKQVLSRLESGSLDTNLCVAAVCGLDDAPEAIYAVEQRSIAGKVVVYPECRGLALTLLEDLPERLPAVAERLKDGIWCDAAENVLLKLCSGKLS